MQGIVVINKEKGYTSFDVVARLRGILKTKKIGHTGTLDPEAEGVLVCCVGRATKLVDTFINHDKLYKATLLLGKSTDSYDVWGETIYEKRVALSEDNVSDVIYSFVGRQSQLPPMYSAKKVGGKKLYELAREGKIVDRAPVDIRIYDIDITEINLPEVEFLVSCSKGTYIRSLCHDIGEKLGCGGCMSSLFRVKSGDFTIEQAHTLYEVEKAVASGNLSDILLSVDSVLNYKKLYAKGSAGKLIENGNTLRSEDIAGDSTAAIGESVLMYHPDGRFAATYICKGDYYKLDKFFLE